MIGNHVSSAFHQQLKAMRVGRAIALLALSCSALLWIASPRVRSPPSPSPPLPSSLSLRLAAIEADVTTVDLSLRAAGSTLSEAAASLLSVSSATAARTASAVHSSEPLSLPANSPPSKACAPGCELRGNCNLELGRCDCPPFMGGPACSDHLFESCSILPGLREVAPAPCLRESLSQMAPVSCECLRECERIGLMGLRDCYVIDVSDQSLTEWVRSQRTLRGLTANLHFWPAALNGSDAVSVSKCSGRGVFAPAMHGERPPAGRAQCWCYAGFAGVACERRTEERELRMCINSCNRRGKCVRNWCHCDKGFYGTDCSLGSSPEGAPPAPALPPRVGAQTDANAPRLYIYELPPRFNSWMQAGTSGWWQDMDLWGEDVIIHRRALSSLYRVTDPEQADFFLVPVWVSSAMWQANWGFRDLLVTGVRAVDECIAYIRTTWPYFDRHAGADHLWVFGHDQGGWRIRAKVPSIGESIFLSPFGGGSAQRGGHRKGHDIVVPPVLNDKVQLGLLNHVGRKRKARQNLAFFQGKLNLHIPYEYSFGIRQGLYKAHRNTPGIVVKEGHEANQEAYFENMCSSRFCVAAAGFGFSTRAYEAATAGCVPLIMQDGIEQAFEDLLSWDTFSLRLNNSLAQIDNLDRTIAAIPEERTKAMRNQLYCIWPRFLWLRHDGSDIPLPAQQSLLRFDAFESVMWTLRKRKRRDITLPLDWEEACREVTRYFRERPQSMGSMPWAPWANYDFDTPTTAV